MSVPAPFIAALFALSLMVASPASAEDWTPKQQGEERSDINTYVRSVSDTPIKQFRGVVEIQHSMVAALSVMDNLSLCSQWIYNCQEADYHYTDKGERLMWMKFDGVWPASDRDILVKAVVLQDKQNGAVTVQTTGRPDDAPEQSRYVRIPMLENSFLVEPLEDGWIRVTFTTHMDPGGQVPAWVANIVATDAPIRTLEGLKRMMKTSPYRDYSNDAPPKELVEKYNLRLPTSDS